MSKEALSKEDKKLVMELFKSSFMLEGCYNYERQRLGMPSPYGLPSKLFTTRRKNRRKPW